MKFVLKFERCTSACYPYNVALAWIKFHTPVGFPFLTRGYAPAYHELLQGQGYANESLALS